jgi:5-methylcytosine-specific restriction endonuclease McrA
MPWRRPKVRLNAEEWAKMREYIIDRAEFRCENGMDGMRCATKLQWYTMHVHHRIHRSLGGSDTKDNLIGVCRDCHDLHHCGGVHIRPHRDWIP